MRSVSRGRPVVIAPSAHESKDDLAGPPKVPLRRIRQAILPPRRIGLHKVEKAPEFWTWQSPEIPEQSFQKRSLESRRGFDNFSRRVGSGYIVSTLPPSFSVLQIEGLLLLVLLKILDLQTDKKSIRVLIYPLPSDVSKDF